MIDLLVEQQVNQVVVRNIGEQMLGKLLARQFAVYQTDCGSRLLRELSDPIASGLVPLSQSNQGRQSLNHDAKNKSDGCCASEGKAPEKNNCQSAIQHQRRKGIAVIPEWVPSMREGSLSSERGVFRHKLVNNP